MNKYKIGLYMIIRNKTILPIGLAQNRSMEDIDDMSYKTMEAFLKQDMWDWPRCVKTFKDAEARVTAQRKSEAN